MKKFYSTGILAVALILISCTGKNEGEINGNCGCKNLYGLADDALRSDSRTLKGHILFSWKNTDGGWNYSIVPNLNVISAFNNVGEGNSFTGEECLKKNLAFLAVGEEIFWVEGTDIETTEGDEISLSFPPAEIFSDIQEYCESIGIKLITSED